MSGAQYFDDTAAINPFMNKHIPIDRAKAQAEHDNIKAALRQAGVQITQVVPPPDCQDGVYTANWALIRGNKALLSALPAVRKNEEAYAERILQELGKDVIRMPDDIHFSGQGDALPCGDYLFIGTGYRTQPKAHQIIAETLGYTVIALQAVPRRTWFGRPAINKDSGWPDSFFYDIDLALAVLKNPGTHGEKGLIAWCPEAFTKESRKKLHAFDGVDKIEVSLAEAKQAFACNLVSNGETVIMSDGAPQFQETLEERGFITITPRISELAKGGGYIRCTTLTLNNP